MSARIAASSPRRCSHQPERGRCCVARQGRDGGHLNTPKVRLAAIRLVHAPVTSVAAKQRWTDTANGFRAHSAALLKDPQVGVFRDVFDAYELLAYLPIRAARLGLRTGRSR